MNSLDIEFLREAKKLSKESKDPSTKVGCIITSGKYVVTQGFNKIPEAIATNEMYEDRSLKNQVIIHAEVSAILDCDNRLSEYIREGTAYIYPLLSCAHCTSVLIEAGIKRVVSLESDNPRWKESLELSKILFQKADIVVDLYKESDSDVHEGSLHEQDSVY